jgi:hypothetical protein
VTLEPLLRRLDRIAGGRHADLEVPASMLEHRKTKRAFTWITWLLAVEVVLGFAAVVVAVVIALNHGQVPFAVWMRSVVVLGMTVTLFYFSWRASRGWYWAYQRLRLFAQIFPIITLVMAAIPNLYPAWMVTEQIVFSLIMIGVADILIGDHMRTAFRRPDRPEARDAATA